MVSLRNDIFSKILRGDLPCKKIHENNYILAFYDINPQSRVHAVVITKRFYQSLQDFTSRAKDDEIVGFWSSIHEVTEKLKVNAGYKLVSHIGKSAGQEIEYFHIHILAT
jgi:histidine triad (HIT) family protein